MKKARKIIFGIILTPIILFLLTAALFYFPPFQNWAVRQVARYASDLTSMEVSVAHVNLVFPLNLSVDEVSVRQLSNDSTTDTIADIKNTLVSVQLLPLFSANIVVDELLLNKTRFNTADFIAQATVKGRADRVSLKSKGIDLLREHVSIDDVLLSGANIDVQLNDTIIPEDTTTSDTRWQIVLSHLVIEKTNVSLHLSGDAEPLALHLGKAEVKDGFFDLMKAEYRVGRATISNSMFFYGNDIEIPIKKVLAAMQMDSVTLQVSYLIAETEHSRLKAEATMDLNAFDEINPGHLDLKANAELGKEDLMPFLADIPQAFRIGWPHYPLAIDAQMSGNIKRLNINRFEADLPTAFTVDADGFVEDFLDTDKLLANVNINASTYNLNFVTHAFLDRDMQKLVRVPSGIRLGGNVKADGNNYIAHLRASQGGGTLSLNGCCNIARMAYNATIATQNFPLNNFLPNMGLSPLTANVKLKGNGTDVFSKKTRLDAEMLIDSFHYSDYDLSGSNATAQIENGEVNARINCVNDVLEGSFTVDALMDLKDIRATLACSLDKADLYGMNLVSAPLTTSLCAHVDVASDLEDYYKVEGFISDVVIEDSISLFRTEELSLNLQTRSDSTWAQINSGDLSLDFSASGGYKSLLQVADNLSQELTRQIERKYIMQDSLKQVLPISHLRLHTGKENFICSYVRSMGYTFRTINAELRTSPTDGINGWAQADSLIVSGMQLDKVRLDVLTDDNTFKYKVQIKNEKRNPDYCFNALLDGSLFETGSDMNLRLYDADDKLGIKLGVKAMLEENGIRLCLAEKNSILGYRTFVANDDNYIFISDDNRLSAYMLLKDEDGTGLQIYSDDDNIDALQDITLGINHLDLSSIVAIIPYCPRIEGILEGDFHVIQTAEELSVSSSLGIDNLKYEDCAMGDLSTEIVYIPKEDGGHYVDGILFCNGDDVGTIKGTYKADAGDGVLDAKLRLNHLPLGLVNGFIPNQVMGLRGTGDGVIDISGKMKNLDISGSVNLNDSYLYSLPYGVELQFDNRPVKIEHSVLHLQNFVMYSHNDQQLTINGTVNFADVEDMRMDMRMKARNFLLINSKEMRKSETFGKAFVNFDASVSGPVEALGIKGNLDVLGTTNMTYILRDSPLSNENRLEELVTFTDFSDDYREPIAAHPANGGIYMDLNIGIDQGAHILCALNAEKSNYLDIIGGGNLRFVYTDEDMRLTGRYTLKSGELKYSLPVIPLKTFDIQDGSFVEFTGDVMNPTLSITALEATKATVNTDGSDRSVAFNCGVKITQTLSNMGLEFIVDAPEDMAVNNRLQSMSMEERGKVAVTMLTTGMYLTDNNASSLSMNSALNSFLQSEINSITGNALRTLDLSIGIDNSTDATGTYHTDYSFKFAKRFWNNRFRVVVGGKVSDNADTEELFDNVSLEYRLDQSANTNLELFYKRNVYDYLEGYLENYGVGIIWKKKTQSFSDLMKKVKKTIVTTFENYIKPEGAEKQGENEKPELVPVSKKATSNEQTEN